MKWRIYRPAKTAMQSGRARSAHWVLEPEPDSAPRIDGLTGWTASSDTGPQVRLSFPTREAAVAHARANGLDYEAFAPRDARPVLKSYADNFRHDRLG